MEIFDRLCASKTFILNDTIKNNVGIFDIKIIKSKKKVIECLSLLD